jgi:hypothetical protein
MKPALSKASISFTMLKVEQEVWSASEVARHRVPFDYKTVGAYASR